MVGSQREERIENKKREKRGRSCNADSLFLVIMRRDLEDEEG